MWQEKEKVIYPAFAGVFIQRLIYQTFLTGCQDKQTMVFWVSKVPDGPQISQDILVLCLTIGTQAERFIFRTTKETVFHQMVRQPPIILVLAQAGLLMCISTEPQTLCVQP